MFHFTMSMPLYLMALYGSIMLVLVLLIRGLFKNKLPKFIFPLLWCMVLIRLLVPFSLSTPMSTPLSQWIATWPTPIWQDNYGLEVITEDIYSSSVAAEDVETLDSEAHVTYPVVLEETAVTEDFAAVSEWRVPERNFAVPFLRFTTSDWIKMLLSIYMIGIISVALYLGWQKVKYSRILKTSLLVEHNEVINNILRTMGMGHVLVFTSDHIASPLVSGWVHPRIYLPARMNFQNTQCLHHILTHEAMHIKRKDNWVKVLMIIALCLNWYNPLVWLMSNCLSSDIEAACDAAVLKVLNEEERSEYATSLLAMAITGNRQTLLYSAFSKTEVEKRIRAVLEYRKAPFLLTLTSILLLTMGSVVFAGSTAAPFTDNLSSYYSTADCKWGVQTTLKRDIVIGKYGQYKANDAIHKAMKADYDNDSDILKENILISLSEIFGVEKGAFEVNISLILDSHERNEEYKKHGIIKNETDFYNLNGIPIRVFMDEAIGLYETSWTDGEIDITIRRDTKGNISEVILLREGDSVYDDRINPSRR